MIPIPPADAISRRRIERLLVNYVFPDAKPAWSSDFLLPDLPQELRCVLHHSFLPELSMAFRDAAHDGRYDAALYSGTVLLALYLILYPRFYPQTGVSQYHTFVQPV